MSDLCLLWIHCDARHGSRHAAVVSGASAAPVWGAPVRPQPIWARPSHGGTVLRRLSPAVSWPSRSTTAAVGSMTHLALRMMVTGSPWRPRTHDNARSVHRHVYWSTEGGVCPTPGEQLAGSGGLF